MVGETWWAYLNEAAAAAAEQGVWMATREGRDGAWDGIKYGNLDDHAQASHQLPLQEIE